MVLADTPADSHPARCYSAGMTTLPANTYLHDLIVGSGGTVDGDFVTKPGCMIFNQSGMNGAAYDLLQKLNMDLSQPSYQVMGEFNSRITYLSFPKTIVDSTPYLNKVANEMNHMSIFGTFYVTFLVAGISTETALEMIAHKEAKVARLTTSATKAMDHPLYYLDPEFAAYQKPYLNNLPLDNPS